MLRYAEVSFSFRSEEKEVLQLHQWSIPQNFRSVDLHLGDGCPAVQHIGEMLVGPALLAAYGVVSAYEGLFVVPDVEAERNLVVAELEMLRAKTAAQDTEIALLKERLQHKEELLAVYNYFTKIKTVE